MIIRRDEIWKETVELMFTVQTIWKRGKLACDENQQRNMIYQQDSLKILAEGTSVMRRQGKMCFVFRLESMLLTSSSLMTGDSRSLFASPSISTSSSCFSQPKTFTSSLSVVEPPPGSVVGVGAFEGDNGLGTVMIVVDEDDDDMCRSDDFDSLAEDDLIERSSVVVDDEKSVLLG